MGQIHVSPTSLFFSENVGSNSFTVLNNCAVKRRVKIHAATTLNYQVENAQTVLLAPGMHIKIHVHGGSADDFVKVEWEKGHRKVML